MSGQWSGEIADVHAKWVNGKVELVWPENERHLQALADYEAIQALVNEVNQAVIRTEERIIKLITTNSIERLGFYGEKILLSPLEAHRGYDSDLDDEQFIALIKGENK